MTNNFNSCMICWKPYLTIFEQVTMAVKCPNCLKWFFDIDRYNKHICFGIKDPHDN